jgi:hypothetical protein
LGFCVSVNLAILTSLQQKTDRVREETTVRSLTKFLRMVRTLRVWHSDRDPVLGRRRRYGNVLAEKEFHARMDLYLGYSLLVSTLFIPGVDVVAQFTLISLPITKRLFMANSAFAAA